MSGCLSFIGMIVFIVFVKAEIQAWDDPKFTDRVIVLRESISTMSVLPPPSDIGSFDSSISPPMVRPSKSSVHRGDSMLDNVPLTPVYVNDRNGNFELKY